MCLEYRCSCCPDRLCLPLFILSLTSPSLVPSLLALQYYTCLINFLYKRTSISALCVKWLSPVTYIPVCHLLMSTVTSEFGRSSFSYSARHIWNNLPFVCMYVSTVDSSKNVKTYVATAQPTKHCRFKVFLIL